MSHFFVYLLCLLPTLSWASIIPIPSGSRAQYLVFDGKGGYKYGYDTADGNAAKQSADPTNEVEGFYAYTNPSGQKINLKYTSGIQGFRVEDLKSFQHQLRDSPQPSTISNLQNGYLPPIQSYSSVNDGSYKEEIEHPSSGDASYNFKIDTNEYKRTESSDVNGNVRGSYSYVNSAGTHDLQYLAGKDTGFVAASGSLSQPNGLGQGAIGKTHPEIELEHSRALSVFGPSSKNDGSYSFKFSTDTQDREENSDAKGNVQGRYSYKNSAGYHDLSYVAGSDTGFLATGGSLSPNGLPQTHYIRSQGPISSSSSSHALTSQAKDGSYAFSYSTGDASRHESSDANGNVQGGFSYTNAAGTHDLKYVAGGGTGFLPTGGSLASPNGLGNSAGLIKSNPSYNEKQISNEDDGSYKDQDDGVYIEAKDQTGGISSSDASYSFSFDTPSYKRQESSDSKGNIAGRYVYQNSAGTHDLSFIAGSATGFLPTGGSLSNPNGLSDPGRLIKSDNSYHYEKQISNEDDGSYKEESDSTYVKGADDASYKQLSDGIRSGDASYSFDFDTPTYKRQESSDSKGNVIGKYIYHNSAGTHDLSFVAGSATGFLPTGGSLTPAPGLARAQLRSQFQAPIISTLHVPQITSSRSAVGYSNPTSYKLGKVLVRTYLPSSVGQKYGYSFATK